MFGNLFSMPVVGRDGKKVPKVFTSFGRASAAHPPHPHKLLVLVYIMLLKYVVADMVVDLCSHPICKRGLNTMLIRSLAHTPALGPLPPQPLTLL